MKKKILAALLFLSTLFSLWAVTEQEIRRSIIKIYAVSSTYNYLQPWQMKPSYDATGSGVLIEEGMILTNAHVIQNQKFIQVKKGGSATKYTARLKWVSHQADLAILTVDDPGFYKDLTPLELGELPEIRDKVALYGFPVGGDKLSITEGIISRIETTGYVHSNARLMACQIDAAINSGNSGGPAIVNGRIAGIAFQGKNNAENIGYLVPPPVIRHFLEDIKDGSYDGFPELGIGWQKLESSTLRSYFRMNEEQTGIRITHVLSDSAAAGYLEVNDIILSVDGLPVANDGTIQFRSDESTDMSYRIQTHQIGSSTEILFLRDGQPMTVSIPLTRTLNSGRLVPFKTFETPPTYFILGGFVFQPLDENLLSELAAVNRASIALMNYYYSGFPEKRDEVVLIQTVLADELNVGYHQVRNLVVLSLNDQPVNSIEDLVRIAGETDERWLRIETEEGLILVLDREEASRREAFILQKYGIPAGISEDLADY